VAFLAKLTAATTPTTDVDDILERLLEMPRCKIAKLVDALPLGAAPVAIGQLPSESAPTPVVMESNAKMIWDVGLSPVAASPISKISRSG
jgi:hypothetical protein